MPHCLILLCAFGSCIARTYAAPVPALPAIQAIVVSTPSDWSIVIGKGGGAMIGVGSDGHTFVPIPDGSLDFRRVYAALAAVARQNRRGNPSFEISFLRRRFGRGTVRYTDSASVIRPIFDTAGESLRRSRDQLDESLRTRAYELDDVWKSRPPVPERPNQAMQRTAGKPEFYVLRVCHTPLHCVGSHNGLVSR